MRRLIPGVSGALAAMLALAGCGSGDKNDHGQQKVTAIPAQTLNALYGDALQAVRTAMPAGQIDEIADTDRPCGGLDVLDSKDASKIIKSAGIHAVGDASDERSPGDLVGEAVRYLQAHGWQIDSRQRAAGDIAKTMTKSGASGNVEFNAKMFRLTSGKSVPVLTASVVTACLPNPDWKG